MLPSRSLPASLENIIRSFLGTVSGEHSHIASCTLKSIYKMCLILYWAKVLPYARPKSSLSLPCHSFSLCLTCLCLPSSQLRGTLLPEDADAHSSAAREDDTAAVSYGYRHTAIFAESGEAIAAAAVAAEEAEAVAAAKALESAEAVAVAERERKEATAAGDASVGNFSAATATPVSGNGAGPAAASVESEADVGVLPTTTKCDRETAPKVEHEPVASAAHQGGEGAVSDAGVDASVGVGLEKEVDVLHDDGGGDVPATKLASGGSLSTLLERRKATAAERAAAVAAAAAAAAVAAADPAAGEEEEEEEEENVAETMALPEGKEEMAMEDPAAALQRRQLPSVVAARAAAVAAAAAAIAAADTAAPEEEEEEAEQNAGENLEHGQRQDDEEHVEENEGSSIKDDGRENNGGEEGVPAMTGGDGEGKGPEAAGAASSSPRVVGQAKPDEKVSKVSLASTGKEQTGANAGGEAPVESLMPSSVEAGEGSAEVARDCVHGDGDAGEDKGEGERTDKLDMMWPNCGVLVWARRGDGEKRTALSGPNVVCEY